MPGECSIFTPSAGGRRGRSYVGHASRCPGPVPTSGPRWGDGHARLTWPRCRGTLEVCVRAAAGFARLFWRRAGHHRSPFSGRRFSRHTNPLAVHAVTCFRSMLSIIAAHGASATIRRFKGAPPRPVRAARCPRIWPGMPGCRATSYHGGCGRPYLRPVVLGLSVKNIGRPCSSRCLSVFLLLRPIVK